MNHRRNVLAVIDTRDPYIRELLFPLQEEMGLDVPEELQEIPIEDDLHSDLEVVLSNRKQRWEDEVD